MTEWILSSCLLIAVVLLLRAGLGRRISAGLRYGLWLVVLIRLLVPVSITTLSFTVPQLPEVTPPPVMQEKNIYVLPVDRRPVEGSGVFVLDDGELGTTNSFGYPKLSDSGETVTRYAGKISPAELLVWIWRAGAVVMGAVLVAANAKFYLRLRRMRRRLDDAETPVPVYVAGGVPSPCLFGVFRPAVYVTEEAASNPAMLRHVLCHELTHYKHFDHIWSILRGAALAVHWWNPLVWAAVVCSRRDGELACDEGALKRLGDGERTAYGETLLALVSDKARPGDLFTCATTMAGGKRSLRERIRRIARGPEQLASAMAAAIVVLSLTVVVAFGQGSGSEEPQAPAEPEIPGSVLVDAEAPLRWTPDLNRDGVPEDLFLREGKEAGEWQLEIREKASDEVLWSVTLDETHGNCDTYFLYQEDGKEYLLEYLAKMQQGYCTYSYRLFHLDRKKEVTDVENSLEFDINFDSPDHRFDPGEITEFMREINTFIGGSHLLLNTNHWMLNLEEDAEGRTRDNILASIGWRGGTAYETDEDLLAALTEFASYAGDHPDDIESPLGILLEDLTPEDIGDISAQGEVTAGDLTKLLQNISGYRSSRYHTYASFEEEEVWTWSMGEWAVPLADGGTLHLIACDSGNIELSYETPEGAVSAFYGRSPALHRTILKVGTRYTKVLSCDADLDRDGRSDELAVRSASDDGTLWVLQCTLSSGGTWEMEAGTGRDGWNAVFLCRLDGEDYLLQYVPHFAQMKGNYRYKLFYLDQKTAKEAAVQENALEFQVSWPLLAEGSSVYSGASPKEIAAFMDEVNPLLADSTPLLNTDRYLQNVFANEGRLYDSMIFLQETRDPDRTLLENLLIYQNHILADRAIDDIHRIDRVTEESIVSASLEDGTPVSKAEIASILQSDHGTSFQEKGGWESEYPVIVVKYVTPEDPGEQTLTLQAGTSGGNRYVRITYEGVRTVLQYSENPEVEGTYLTDVPYDFDGYIYTGDIYDRVAALSE